MKYDKTTIIGVALCVLLLVLWGPVMRQMGLQPAPRTKPPAVAPPAADDDSATGTAPATALAAADDPTPTLAAADDPTPTVAAPLPVPEPAAPPMTAEFRTPRATVELTPSASFAVVVDADGGGITQVRLNDYLADDRQSSVTIGRFQHPFCALIPDAAAWQAGPARLVEQTPTYVVLERELLGAYQGMTLTERWEADPEAPYNLGYRITVANRTDQPRSVRGLAVSCGAVKAPSTGGRRSRAMPGAGGEIDVMVKDAKKAKTYNIKNLRKLKPEVKAQLARTRAQWLAIHSKYFLFCARGQAEAVAGCAVGLTEPDPGSAAAKPWLHGALVLAPATVAPGATASWDVTGYAGPKEFQRLRDFGDRLESIMKMDLFLFWRPAWMGLITRQILRALIGLNRAFNHEWGYGFAIIVITFVIKMLFWPLTHRSTASMRKMQTLQPIIKEIRENYKDQPEKMNRKIMDVYRENNVSPLGGCLPMLFQIPVFFALFNTFRSAIELRQATFIWVADLSMPDTVAVLAGLPIRPLAILMATSMLVQQKMMPSSDPSQARMMMFMSIFFLFIFYSMPAGLTLYWTVNQVLTIVQNLVSKRMEKNSAAPTR